MSQANIDAVRESVAASPKNPTATVHRSRDSHTLLLVVCLPLVDIMQGKASTLIIMRNVLVGEGPNSCERWR